MVHYVQLVCYSLILIMRVSFLGSIRTPFADVITVLMCHIGRQFVHHALHKGTPIGNHLHLVATGLQVLSKLMCLSFSLSFFPSWIGASVMVFCVLFTFYSRSIDVPFAFILRAIEYARLRLFPCLSVKSCPQNATHPKAIVIVVPNAQAKPAEAPSAARPALPLTGYV